MPNLRMRVKNILTVLLILTMLFTGAFTVGIQSLRSEAFAETKKGPTEANIGIPFTEPIEIQKNGLYKITMQTAQGKGGQNQKIYAGQYGGGASGYVEGKPGQKGQTVIVMMNLEEGDVLKPSFPGSFGGMKYQSSVGNTAQWLTDGFAEGGTGQGVSLYKNDKFVASAQGGNGGEVNNPSKVQIQGGGKSYTFAPRELYYPALGGIEGAAVYIENQARAYCYNNVPGNYKNGLHSFNNLTWQAKINNTGNSSNGKISYVSAADSNGAATGIAGDSSLYESLIRSGESSLQSPQIIITLQSEEEMSDYSVPVITVEKGKAFSIPVGYYDDMKSKTANGITVTNATLGDNYVVVSGTLDTVGTQEIKVGGRTFIFDVKNSAQSNNSDIPVFSVCQNQPFDVLSSAYDDMQSGKSADGSVEVVNTSTTDKKIHVKGKLLESGEKTIIVNGKTFIFKVLEAPTHNNVKVILNRRS